MAAADDVAEAAKNKKRAATQGPDVRATTWRRQAAPTSRPRCGRDAWPQLEGMVRGLLSSAEGEIDGGKMVNLLGYAHMSEL